MAVEKKYDVVVAGSGPGGIGAAFAAARAGAKTLIIEKNAVLGGQMTSGLVTGFHGMRVHKGFTKKGLGSILMEDKHTPVVARGLSLEIMNRLTMEGAAYSTIDDPPMRIEYDPEALIPLLFKMADGFKLDVLVDSFVFGVEMDGDRIASLRVANKSGEVRIKAKTFVDGTADGDLIDWSGAGFLMGDPKTKRCMPLSVYQVLGNVDLQKTMDYFKENPDDLHISTIERWQEMYDKGAPVSLIGLKSLVNKAARNGEYPRAIGLEAEIPYPIFDIQTSFLPRGTVKLLVDMAYGVDITDGDALSAAEKDMRMNQVPGIFRFMKKYVPGFEKCYIISTSPLIGTRESRRLDGIYQITKDDVLSNRKFEDSIGRCGRAMNVHSSGGGNQNQDRGGQQWIEAENPIGFDIPYRSLLPRKIKNLAASGRCISVDRDALGSIRGEATCMVAGEAAGAAAALAAGKNISMQDVPVPELQGELTKHNVII
ncbi:FAD-dependent oxidoreductase [Breznakiella homolactica]|uniref:FAD-dependent oxidoreductase n=1 Tax=Breznakiella homolactica TaxID=2798577 RepID=A0A7T8BBS6_9SPIR|nr:FAD-dependent oxidoreductase [Breznakiella homolactica]QQO10686.1 FAD-dependent oxidoreductase [Breznakiella homolactica]